ncbi:hypothetical protein [uncultured Clostridium sp.]|uniref:hypothetical protein n=1 Tax=uncultured Clostridium sp. TaxID=59620 RepID=UPI0025FE8FE3|nr:hypothetical protein [uncultured Clostridium sp.]
MRKNLRKLICTTTVAVVLLGASNTVLASNYSTSIGCNVSSGKVNSKCNNTWKHHDRKPECGTTKPDCDTTKPSTTKPDCGTIKPSTTKPDCDTTKPSTTNPGSDTTKPSVSDKTEETTKPSVDKNETTSTDKDSKSNITTPVVNKNENSNKVEEATLGVSDIKKDNKDAKTIDGVKTGDNNKLPIQVFIGTIASGALFAINRFLRR